MVHIARDGANNNGSARSQPEPEPVQHGRLQGPVMGWPPPDSDAWQFMVKNADVDTVATEAPHFTADRCSMMARHLRAWSSRILAGQTVEVHGELLGCVTTLDQWAESLLVATGQRRPSRPSHLRWKFDSQLVLECIRVASYLKGGSRSLCEVAKLSLALLAPHALPTFWWPRQMIHHVCHQGHCCTIMNRVWILHSSCSCNGTLSRWSCKAACLCSATTTQAPMLDMTSCGTNTQKLQTLNW